MCLKCYNTSDWWYIMAKFIIEGNILKEIIVEKSEDEIIIPDGVEIIDSEVFSFADDLFSKPIIIKKLVMPSSVNKLNDRAFLGLKKVQEIVMSDNIKIIPTECFRASGDIKIHIPTSLLTIKAKAFMYSETKEIELNNKIQIIEQYAFANSSLSKINYPDSLIFFGNGVFMDTDLEMFVAPKNLKSLNQYCLSECPHLHTIILNEGLEIINTNAISVLPKIKSITIPSTIIDIQKGAISNLPNLEEILIKEGVKSISNNAFESNGTIGSLKLPKSFQGIMFNFDTEFEKIEVATEKGVEHFNYTAIGGVNDIAVYKADCVAFGYINGKGYLCDIRSSVGNFVYSADSFDQFPELEMYEKHFGIRYLSIVKAKFALYCAYLENFNALDPIKNSRIHNIPKQVIFPDISVLSCLGVKLYPNIIKYKSLWQRALRFLDNPSIFESIKLFKGDMLNSFDERNKREALLKLCVWIGLFNDDQRIRTKAINFVDHLVRDKEDIPPCWYECFYCWKADKQMPERFCNFVMENFDKIIREDEDFVGALYNNFDKMQKVYSHKSGRLKLISLEEAKEYFKENKFYNISEGNEALALEISKYYNQQDIFEDIQKLHAEAKHLAENTVDELRIFGVKDNSKSVIKYEFLKKDDPRNYILGVACNCCFKVDDMAEELLVKSVKNPFYCNCIFTKNSEIIAKSTVYINTELGYAVYNNIEINHDFLGVTSNGKKINKPVFEAGTDEEKKILKDILVKSAKDLATEYNNKNPKSPLKSVTIGLSHNDLNNELISSNKKSDKIYKMDQFYDYVPDCEGESQIILWESVDEKKVDDGQSK